MAGEDALFDTISQALEAGRTVESITEDLWERFGETAAVLILDSTGFTRTTQQLGIAHFLAIISRLRAIGELEFRRYGVLEWRAVADNLYASFRDVDHAIAAAFAIHDELKRNPILINNDEALSVCIGVGYGRLLRSEREGFYGDEMNLASKLGEDIAKAGETLLTVKAFENLTRGEAFVIEKKKKRISGVTLSFYSLQPGR